MRQIFRKKGLVQKHTQPSDNFRYKQKFETFAKTSESQTTKKNHAV